MQSHYLRIRFNGLNTTPADCWLDGNWLVRYSLSFTRASAAQVSNLNVWKQCAANQFRNTVRNGLLISYLEPSLIFGDQRSQISRWTRSRLERLRLGANAYNALKVWYLGWKILLMRQFQNFQKCLCNVYWLGNVHWPCLKWKIHGSDHGKAWKLCRPISQHWRGVYIRVSRQVFFIQMSRSPF